MSQSRKSHIHYGRQSAQWITLRLFCASARARFQVYADFDAKRQFLQGRVDRVIYNRYKVTVMGSVPLRSASGETKLQVRIRARLIEGGTFTRPRRNVLKMGGDLS
jgi:hypothetical protein